MFTFQSGKTENYGIPVDAVRKMEEMYERLGVRLHGYMLLGGREILAERYWAPYGENVNHRMYSITKSFVALAVGLLVKNNLVKLTDKICDYFPEKLPEEGAHPWCAEMTIEDMLSMRTCYKFTTFKVYGSDDWTESFFKMKPDHIPGTMFNYDTSAPHTLAALVEKLTGMKMLDYMRQEFLDELGFSKEAYIIEDPVGVSQGGSGLMSTLRDVARVAYLCNHYGVLDGKELLPTDYMRKALGNVIPTDLQPKLDEKFGYGYYMWMTREEGFVFYGMGGQLAVCFPKYDFVYLTMSDVLGSPAGLQIIFDGFYQNIYPYLKERKEDNPLAFEENDLTGYEEQKQSICPNANHISGTYRFYPNNLKWRSVTFDWDKNEMSFEIPAGEFTLNFGDAVSVATNAGPARATGVIQPFLNTGFDGECRGYWKRGLFYIEVFMVDEEQGHVRMEFAWKDRRLSMRVVSTGDPFIKDTELQKCFQGFASAECLDFSSCGYEE